MFAVPGIVSLGLAAISSGVFYLSARELAARALIGRGSLITLGLDHASWAKVSFAKKLAFAASGPLACYVLASILFSANLLIAGKRVVDPNEMHIWVDPDGAAATAGIRGGDEIISIDDVPVTTWPGLGEQMDKRDDKVRVGVRHRDGQIQSFDVTLTHGRLGVMGQEKSVHVGVAAAIGLGLLVTPRMWRNVGRGLMKLLAGGREPSSLTPAVMGRNALALSVGAVAERVAAIVGYYFLVLSLLLALIFWPGARWFGDERGRPEKAGGT